MSGKTERGAAEDRSGKGAGGGDDGRGERQMVSRPGERAPMPGGCPMFEICSEPRKVTRDALGRYHVFDRDPETGTQIENLADSRAMTPGKALELRRAQYGDERKETGLRWEPYYGDAYLDNGRASGF